MIVGKTEVRVREFQPAGGVRECHLVVRLRCGGLPFSGQCRELLDAYDSVVGRMTDMNAVFERYFLSDAATQQDELEKMLGARNCAVSVVEQPPLDGTKVAMWAVLVEDASPKRLDSGIVEVSHGSYTHLLSGSMTASGRDSKAQAKELLVDYSERIGEAGCTLFDNCARTWFFVQNIDVNYSGVVTARNDVFSAQGLTNDTHFIASTGIGGRTSDRTSLVMMEAYSVKGLQPGQMSYLYASTHLNRTSEYGVSFERGARVDYGDRRHVYISGTASIDNCGKVLHVGDVRLQTERMLENVSRLLEEAGCSFADVAHIIVYLRDIADYRTVEEIFGQRFHEIPLVVLYAPVCRPGWLIEMECMAIKEQADTRYPDL